MKALSIGRSDKNLKIISYIHQTLCALFIEFRKNIIQKQNGLLGAILNSRLCAGQLNTLKTLISNKHLKKG